uniref:DUF7865 domain-containing protein n=1 Tax=Populus alba TaxID=43335 RepID=A0A4U5NSS8_POPAL|nr:uncharacterized protein D5086_0000241030 [Populus alba]
MRCTVLGHGIEVATKLKGSTSHDQLLIQTSESFSGLLLFVAGFLLFMVAFVRDKEFQIFFAKGCTSLHVSVAFWRVYFEQKLEDLARDLLRLVVGVIALALSWVFFLVYSWRENDNINPTLQSPQHLNLSLQSAAILTICDEWATFAKCFPFLSCKPGVTNYNIWSRIKAKEEDLLCLP